MPHLDISHFPKDFTGEQKDRLAAALTTIVVEHFGVRDAVVSIALRPVDPQDWDTQIVAEKITGQEHRLIKAPHYGAA
jgi:4-oxalocrotonate tautomerase